MRLFIAFIISLSIYILLIWLFVTQFSKVEITPHQKNEHIIKIDLKNISIPKKSSTKKHIAAKDTTPKTLPLPIKKSNAVKPTIKKRPKVIKKTIKKKTIKKKKIKKKIIKKKKIVKKKPKIHKKHTIKKPIKKIKPKVDTTDDMVYIPEPFIKPAKVAKRDENSLSSFLSTPTQNSTPTRSYPNKKIKKLYGSSFQRMTPTQQQFIENNLDTIQQITQETLTRRGYPEAASRTGQEGTNVVEFNLHPNGDISHLRLKTRIGYRSLDENTITLIRVAYKDYPYPKTTTKIVFYVTYSFYGY